MYLQNLAKSLTLSAFGISPNAIKLREKAIFVVKKGLFYYIRVSNKYRT